MSRLKDMNDAINEGFADFAGEMQPKRPRYGVRAVAAAADELKAAAGKYPDDMGLYVAMNEMIALAYRQSDWIGKVWGALARAAQEAER